MGYKVSTVCMLAFLLLSFTLFTSSAARPEPAFTETTPAKTANGDVEVEDSCDGIGEDECLMRRTLAAHIDYIYTQKHNP